MPNEKLECDIMDRIEILKSKHASVIVRYDPKKWRRYKSWLVGSNGDVKNILTGKVLTQEYNTRGYLRVTLDKRYLSHRLVMLVWRGASDLEVDHINGNKSDNKLSNLEYVTTEENKRRARYRPIGSGIVSSNTDTCPF